MKKLTMILMSCSLLFLSGCLSDDDEAAAATIVGSWSGQTVDAASGVTAQIDVTFNADATYTMSFGLLAGSVLTPFATESGTYTSTATTITATGTSCQELNMATGVMGTSTCDAPTPSTYTLAGNTMTITDTEGTVTLTRQ